MFIKKKLGKITLNDLTLMIQSINKKVGSLENTFNSLVNCIDNLVEVNELS